MGGPETIGTEWKTSSGAFPGQTRYACPASCWAQSCVDRANALIRISRLTCHCHYLLDTAYSPRGRSNSACAGKQLIAGYGAAPGGGGISKSYDHALLGN